MSIVQYLEDKNNVAQPLAADVFQKLQADILTGKRARGAKLTESKICKEYEVSRTPVREALRQLETDGLIETIPNRGAFVVGFSDQDIRDLSTLRTQAEVQAVRWAIHRITEEELEELKETFDYMTFYTQQDDILKMLNINLAFHQVIYHASHNQMLIQQLLSYQLYLRHCNPSNYYAPGYLRDVLAEHREIYQAILSFDEEAGASAMLRHMNNSARRKLR